GVSFWTSEASEFGDDWIAYGNDRGGLRHSRLGQITPENVQQLKIAWTYRTGELETYRMSVMKEKTAFEATPIMISGRLYLSTPSDRVIALEASTGRELWVYDPKVRQDRSYSEVTSRGVAFWPDPRQKQEGCIFVGTIDGRLIALHSATGRPCDDFGERGVVDLKKGAGADDSGQYQVTSPPAIIGELVVIGSSIADNRSALSESGVVRAFNTRSGQLVWSWDPVPRQSKESGYDTWSGAIAHNTGAANAWAPISADEAADLVFIPTSSPSPDYYGGERRGQNLHANSVVALRGSTGKLVWSFQTVHHDLWDFDVPMQPVLLELKSEGKAVPTVVVATKSGHIFVLDRQTGKPLLPIEERPVPTSDVDGESAWETQPFPTTLPTFGLRAVSVAEAWGLDSDQREKARARIQSLRNEGPFTPPGLRGSIHAPGSVGGFHWGGLTYDPDRGILIGPVNRIATVIKLIPRGEFDAQTKSGKRLEAEIGPMRQTPFVVQRDYLFWRQQGSLLPMTPPPWGTLAAIDLNHPGLKWEVPLGYMLDLNEHPQAKGWGSVNFGGATTTATGLAFIAASVDPHLRAFETETGKLLWEAALPAAAQATPMTYSAGPEKKQFLVICAGGHAKLGSQLGDYVIAFTLPK
ncbi:MAG TPA: pyrroloquinoline quinone-dependent dehydrogenase, partial [Verrucomicrobiae bacterium]|nr:pyrroloquinoline quinone-dependent dehydrogenase [Verrucomicrobiae bacterium]